MTAQRTRWNTPHRLSRVYGLRGEYSGFAPHNRFRFDLGFFTDASLSSNDRVITHRHATRETCLRCHNYVPAQRAVVRHVNKIIQLCAITNLGDAQSRPVNAAVRSNLHVIANVHHSNLRKLFIVVARHRKAKSIRANHSAGVDDGAPADADAIVNCHMPMQGGPIPNRHIVAQHASRPNLASVTDLRILSNENMRAHRATLPKLRGRRNNRRGVNTRRATLSRINSFERFSKGHPRVGDTDYRCGQRFRKGEWHQHAACPRTLRRSQSLASRGKRQIAFPGIFNGVCSGNTPGRVTLGRTGNQVRDLSNSEKHNPPYLTLMAGNEAAYTAPTARIDPGASIGPGTRIGEYCVIESDVVIGAQCVLEPYVYIKRWTTLGNENEISAGTALGTDPLDKSFDGKRSYLRIGHKNKIREHYTISRGTQPESETRMGDGNYIMTSGHIAHNAILGDNIVVASCALVAGYVEIENQAFISGGVVIHQYSKIGRLAMVGGNTRVNSDLPPYLLYSDFNVAARGLNIVGLKRAGFPLSEIKLLKAAYKLLYRAGLPREEALQRIENELPSEHTRHLVSFIRSSKRGICGATRSRAEED